MLALAFLGFYWWILNREFGCRAAWFAALILGTSVAWVFFSQVGVPDLPLSATFSAAMLLALPWIARGETRFLPFAAALLGLAVLAKGLVPLALAAPLVLGGRRLRDLFHLRVLAPFLGGCAPLVRPLLSPERRRILPGVLHQASPASASRRTHLRHVQPAWYYLPVLAGLLLPWTPLVPLIARRATLRDPRRRFLLALVLFGMVLFSISVNKLAGYVLPLVPAIAALIAVSLDELENARWWLAACAVLLAVFPIAVPAAPAAVANGISRASFPAFHWTWLVPILLLAAVWLMEVRGRRVAAVLTIAAGAAAGVIFLRSSAAPAVDRAASARGLWTIIRAQPDAVCVDNIDRAWRYGLNYYSVAPLPECSVEARPIHVVQAPDQPPRVIPAATGRLTPDRPALYPHVSGHEVQMKP